MGATALRDLAHLTTIDPDNLHHHTYAIDAHNWLYKYLTTVVQWMDPADYTTTDGTELPGVLGALRGLPAFVEADITPVFVFDGAPDDLKTDELEQRRDARETAAEQRREAEQTGASDAEIARLRAREQRLDSDTITKTRTLLTKLGFPVLEAPGAGEAQAAHLAATGAVDGVVSDDYDTLLFGAPTTIRQFTGSQTPERMDFEATLADHDLTHDQLIDVALLCGTDYTDGVTGLGPVTAVEAIKTHETIFGVLDARDTDMDRDRAAAARQLFRDPTVTDCSVPELDRRPADAIIEYAVDELGFSDYRVQTEVDRLHDAGWNGQQTLF